MLPTVVEKLLRATWTQEIMHQSSPRESAPGVLLEEPVEAEFQHFGHLMKELTPEKGLMGNVTEEKRR